MTASHRKQELNLLQSGTPARSQMRFLPADIGPLQQNNLVSMECHCGQWESIGLTSGPLLPVLLEHKWQSMTCCLACSALPACVSLTYFEVG